jgi:hypothetical protein
MVRSPTETGGEKRTIELPQSEPTMRTDAAIERWPIGPTGEARRTAFKVRSAPTLPVRPGRGIPFETSVMRERMPAGAAAGSDKSESRSDDFCLYGLDRRTWLNDGWSHCDQV